MNFEQFRAKVFNLSVFIEFNKKLDKTLIPAKLNEIDNPIIDLINEIKKEFGSKELEGIKILAKFL